MSEAKQLNMNVDNLLAETALNDPATIEGIKGLIDKTAPLIQAGRFNNIIDLLSLISDNIEFLDEAAVEKVSKAGEDVLAFGWTTGNAIRMANAQSQALEKPPGLFQLMKSLNEPDVRRSLHFFIGTMRILGRQMKND